MASSKVIAGALAFVGPPHVTTLESFTYLSVVQVQGSTAVVKKTGPDARDSESEFEVKLSVLRHRIVDPTESELWPGSYVGQPIAFIQTAGASCDKWAYGLVTGYSMKGGLAQLNVHHDEHTLHIQFLSTPTVIAVDRLNYALRIGESVNCSVLNALELLDNQNQVIVACGKSRPGLPTSVTSSMLSVPFVPDERVPLIRPDTLEITYVQRQHIVDCELMGRGNDPAAVFKDPLLPDPATTKTTRNSHNGKRRATNDIDLTFSDTDDDENLDQSPTEQADIDLVRLHNRPLRKRARYTANDGQDSLSPDDFDVPTMETRRDNATFRPSQIERQVHAAVAHPSLLGKNAQAVLESAQQSRNTKFLGTPSVLRGAYDISFGVRGLSLMHFRRFFEQLEMHKTASSVNMTNFGRSNALQPATPPAVVCGSLRGSC